MVGASGDLSARKLIPALYNLSVERLLPRQGRIIGAAPLQWTDADFVAFARDAVADNSRTPLVERRFAEFARRLRFVPLDNRGSLAPLRSALRSQRRLVYLAVPPSAFMPLVRGLRDSDLAEGTSLIIEKPFGHDLASARELNDCLHEVLGEEHIFRIDHYMGKETVQNLLVFRFGNAMFERVWNRDAIAAVELTVAESLGVEQRGAFYEGTGAIRDILQNHVFQVLSVTAMEPPVSFEAEAIRNEKVKVLHALRPVDPTCLVRGQYTAGSIDGRRVRGYRHEPGVSPHSTTETYAAMRLHVDNWRWSGVPFLVRTGKRLARRDTRIVVSFRDVPLHLFRNTQVEELETNRLVVRIQPDEGISFAFIAKTPGPEVSVQQVRMDFTYGASFKSSPPEAYERLLHDALAGDHTLFIREDEVERGWQVVAPALLDPPDVVPYHAGSWGPHEAIRLAEPHAWHEMEGG